jgi:3-deoxy-7-phosphoheptulonate synthase
MNTGLLLRPPEYAAQVAATLPKPSESNYQVPYPNRLELVGAMSMLTTVEAVATPEEIRAHRVVDASIATGGLAVPRLTIGNCAELLVSDFDIEMIEALANGDLSIDELELPSLEDAVDGHIAMEDIAYEELGPDASIELRAAGQFFKPRSRFTQKLKSGIIVPSYFGDGVNSRDERYRTPDPRRLIAARVQSLRMKQRMQERGRSPIFAHEALSLPYEHMAVYVDNGERYILSGHRLWVGDRTNDPDGVHALMLSGAVNPMGIKIGPGSSREHIARLAKRFSLAEPGKVSFMIRIPLENQAKLIEIAAAIAEHAPDQLQQLDIHGVTVDGQYEGGDPAKVRSVERTVATVKATHKALGEAGLALHGLHLEAKSSNDRPECVDGDGEVPDRANKPVVDPLFTLNQLRTVLRETRQYLPGA